MAGITIHFTLYANLLTKIKKQHGILNIEFDLITIIL